MGGASGAPARRWLEEHGVPSYDTPEAATRAFLHLVEYRRNRAELLETPPSVSLDTPCCDGDTAKKVIEHALAAGREWLEENEVEVLLDAYGVSLVSETTGPTGSLRRRDRAHHRPDLRSRALVRRFAIGARSGRRSRPVAAAAQPRARPPSGRANRRWRCDRRPRHGAAALDSIASTLVRVRRSRSTRER